VARNLLLKPAPRLREIHGHDVSGQVHSAAVAISPEKVSRTQFPPGISLPPKTSERWLGYDARAFYGGADQARQIRESEFPREATHAAPEVEWTFCVDSQSID
jgi:hypothetical protein